MRKVGLPPDQPYVLYLCSSPFIAPDEVRFVRRWLRRASAAAARSERPACWSARTRRTRPSGTTSTSTTSGTPRSGRARASSRTQARPRADYFDSLAHSACIVGINTSGLIEAGIVGKSVLTVLDPTSQARSRARCTSATCAGRTAACSTSPATSTSTPHSSSARLSRATTTPGRCASFVERFCAPARARPEAAALVADGIEELGRLGRAGRHREQAGTLARRAALYPLALTMTGVSYLLGGQRHARNGCAAWPPDRRSRDELSCRRNALYGRSAASSVAPIVLHYRDSLRPCISTIYRAPTTCNVPPRPPNADRPSGVRPPVDPRRGRAPDRRGAGRDPGRGRPGRVGPWLGEVGFEVLYWIPFLHWLFERHGIPTAEVTVVSRGGAEPWYDGLCGRYVDVLRRDDARRLPHGDARALGGDRRPAETGRGAAVGRARCSTGRSATAGATRRSSTRSSSTASSATSGRRRCRCATSSTGPSTAPWRRARPRGRRLAPGGVHRRAFLLPRLVPRHAGEPRARPQTSIERLAARRPVVLLNTGVVVDEHRDAEPPPANACLRPLAGIDPDRNLAAQSAVIARASCSSAPTAASPTWPRSTACRRSASRAISREINPVHLTIARRTAAAYEPHLRSSMAAPTRCWRPRESPAAPARPCARPSPRRLPAAPRGSWTNVDSSLRLLGEDRTTPVAFGRCDDPLLDALYWQPFIHWAREHFGLAKGADGAVTVPAEPVLALVEQYRAADACRPAPCSSVCVTSEPNRARRRYFPGRRRRAERPRGRAHDCAAARGRSAEADLDLALQVATELGGCPHRALTNKHLTRLLQAIGSRR